MQYLSSVFLLATILSTSTTSKAPDSFEARLKYNLWQHLAEVTNTSNFCLSQGLSAQEILSTCLIPVCHNPSPPGTVSQLSDSLKHYHPAYYRSYWTWGNVSLSLPATALSLTTPHVGAERATCARFNSCKKDCVTPPGEPLKCAAVQDVVSLQKYITLPDGWFFSCGSETYSYVPANLASGTLCCVSRLTVILPSKTALATPARQKRAVTLNTLESSCDSEVHLFTHPEILSLAFSLVGVPGLAAANAKTIGKLACLAVKNINTTSVAISLLNKEQKELRQAILQNRLAIDYLLMRDHYGCEHFQGMCCFNLTDNSRAVSRQLDILHKLAKDVKQRSGSLIDSAWDVLTGWLPDLTWLKHVFVWALGVVIVGVLLCCVVRCLPRVFARARSVFLPTPVPICSLDILESAPCVGGASKNLDSLIWGESQF